VEIVLFLVKVLVSFKESGSVELNCNSIFW